MKPTIFFAVSAAALALAGCGKSENPAADVAASSAPAADVAAETPMSAAPSAANADQAFADAAAASDAFEIESSKLAASKSQDAKVKKFAEQMVRAHTDSTAKLKAAAGAATPAITPAPQLTPMQQQTLADLSGKSGAEFDTAYKKAQLDAHQMTLDKLKAYSTGGAQASLKSFATELVPIVTAHLNMAKGL